MADAERLNFLPPTRAAMVSGEWRQVVAANPQRQAVLITNTSDTAICLAFGGADNHSDICDWSRGHIDHGGYAGQEN